MRGSLCKKLLTLLLNERIFHVSGCKIYGDCARLNRVSKMLAKNLFVNPARFWRISSRQAIMSKLNDDLFFQNPGLFVLIWLVWTTFRFFEARQKTAPSTPSTMVKANLQANLVRETTRRAKHRSICRNVIGVGLVQW